MLNSLNGNHAFIKMMNYATEVRMTVYLTTVLPVRTSIKILPLPGFILSCLREGGKGSAGGVGSGSIGEKIAGQLLKIRGSRFCVAVVANNNIKPGMQSLNGFKQLLHESSRGDNDSLGHPK